MGRVKIAPTPRNTALNDAMRRAAANITSSSSLNLDLARPLPLPEPPSRPPAKLGVKSAAKPQPPQLAARLSREATKDRSSVESQKRKSESTEPSAPPSKKAATDKLVLRSASNLAPTPKSRSHVNATSRASSKANSVEPARRSTRSTKIVVSVDKAAAATDSASLAVTNTTRPTRAQKKTVKAAQTLTPEEQEHQQAISMLQGGDIYEYDNAADEVESPLLARSTRASTRAKSSRASTSVPATPPTEPLTVMDPAMSTPDSANPFPAVDEPAINTVESAPAAMVVTQELDHTTVSPVGLPFGAFTPASTMANSSAQVAYAYPAPDVTPVPYPYHGHMNGFNTDPTNGYHHSGYLAIDKGPVDGSSATSGDSGYATSQPFQVHPYMNGPSPYNNGFVPPYPPLLPANQMPPIHFVSHTKGQKVKGRPTPRNPRSREELTPRGGRNVANTYPRKQPFKAQIEFPGYPPANAPIPHDYTLWEVCQNFPNSLRENTLLPFVQREWSANELCACLKEDAREILNSRPGKDKTMVFQKRMERIKKDLVAKGEFDGLVHGPMIREDGRPTWVKRGNVRRK